MGRYYYSLGKNKTLNYSSKGRFICPAIREQEKLAQDKGEPFFYDQTEHSHPVYTGENYIEYTSLEPKVYENGDKVYTSYRTVKKVNKDRKDLRCKCGQILVFLGYAVWIEKEIKAGSVMDLGALGKARVGHESKRLGTRYFTKKTSQQTYIKQQLAKVRN